MYSLNDLAANFDKKDLYISKESCVQA